MAVASEKALCLLSPFSLEDLRSRCASTSRRLLATCPALLEISLVHDRAQGSVGKYVAWMKSYLSTAQTALNAAEAIYGYKNWIAVQFIHRSAKEFVQENGIGRAFLKENTPPDFSLSKIMVNLKLVDLVMFPPERDDTFRPSTSLISTGAILPRTEKKIPKSAVLGALGRAVQDVMYYVRCLEEETKLAHVSLVHKIDQVVAMVCAQYEFYDPSSHWCLQIDLDLCSLWCLKDFWIAETARLSREQIVADRPVKYSPFKPVDLLSLAAYCHLDLYVENVLTSQPDLNDPTALSRLLSNHLSPLTSRHPTYFPNVRSIVFLLNRGANPNTIYDHASIWQLFLYTMGLVLRTPLDLKTIRAMAHSWGAAINAFIEHGADVNDTIQFESPRPFLDIIEKSENRDELWRLGTCDLVVYQSVLSFLQQFSHVLPEFPQIQSLCLARGARLKSTPRGFYNNTGSMVGGGGFMLSDSESNELSKVCKTYYPIRYVSGTPESREVLRVLTDIWNAGGTLRFLEDLWNDLILND